jgi:hypothetical protein
MSFINIAQAQFDITSGTVNSPIFASNMEF